MVYFEESFKITVKVSTRLLVYTTDHVHLAIKGVRSGNLKLSGWFGRRGARAGAAAPHCAVHTSSRRTASRGHSRRSCAQSVMRRDAHCACKYIISLFYYSSVYINFSMISIWQESQCLPSIRKTALLYFQFCFFVFYSTIASF